MTTNLNSFVCTSVPRVNFLGMWQLFVPAYSLPGLLINVWWRNLLSPYTCTGRAPRCSEMQMFGGICVLYEAHPFLRHACSFSRELTWQQLCEWHEWWAVLSSAAISVRLQTESLEMKAFHQQLVFFWIGMQKSVSMFACLSESLIVTR